MCDNECISKGKCEHNEECRDNVCFTSEQSKVVEKLIAKAKENERAKTIKEVDERFNSDLGSFGFWLYEQLKEQKNECVKMDCEE